MLKNFTTRQNSHRSNSRMFNIESLQARRLMAADLAAVDLTAETSLETTMPSQGVAVDSWFVASEVKICRSKDDAFDPDDPVVTPEDENSPAARRHRDAQAHEAEEDRLRRERDSLEDDDPLRLELSRQLREELEEAIEDYNISARAFESRGRKAEAARDRQSRGDAAQRLADELLLARENGEDISDGEIREALMSSYRGYRMAADLHAEMGHCEHAEELDAIADKIAEEAKQYENDGQMRGNMGR